MRLLLPLAWLALSASANVFSAGDTDVSQLEQRTPHLAKRSSRGKCGPILASSADTAMVPDTLSASASRNVSLGYIRFERNGSSPHPVSIHLGKRMELPNKDIGAFYAKELPNVSAQIAPEVEGATAEQMSTAVVKEFSSVARRKQWSTGTEGLCGCTTMYIISRKAVYATHWFENVSFDPDPEWRKAGESKDDVFEATVLDMLAEGGTNHPPLDPDVIEDEHIHAYLIHPKQTWEEKKGDVGYPKQWDAIRKKVGELVPTLQVEERWTDIAYKSLDTNDDAFNHPDIIWGRNLFKYDPMHIFEPGVKGKLAMLWVEDKLYHEDQW
ncbi:uncharacterized protein DSM5745_08058 [Aspergillus mulundensis]|uniref:Uncharacterized protein n=1 Tax=Aspergillus mulundensis TaxID=1810919 RepID=A0A3D8R918_9EURO|nr:hypothetical protein DSM5745_08058 [Aspergillus mulundensis]RDW70547.1 hypothetical protein DSM5745_08058 [Aspergillus mulundensis]